MGKFLISCLVIFYMSSAQADLVIPPVNAWHAYYGAVTRQQAPIGYSEKATCKLVAELQKPLTGGKNMYLVEYPPSNPIEWHGCTDAYNITPEGYCDDCGTMATAMIFLDEVCPSGFRTYKERDTGKKFCVAQTSSASVENNLGGCRNSRSPFCGNPINFGVGNKFLKQVDYLFSNDRLKFIRYYNSQKYSNSANIGVGWSHNYSARLVELSVTALGSTHYSVRIVRPDGRGFYAVKEEGGAWSVMAESGWFLQKAENAKYSWKLQTPNNKIEYYDNSGRIIKIQYKGYSTSVEYLDDGTIRKISDSFGRELFFRYGEAGNIVSITDPDGRVISYSYDEQGNLINVTHQDSSVRKYIYDQFLSSALVSIIDENSDLYASYDYEFHRKIEAVESFHANESGRVSIDYKNDSRTEAGITFANGTSISIETRLQAGVKKITHISELIESLGLSVAGEIFYYDAKGRVVEIVKHNGVAKNLSYNSRSLVASLTEASNTLQERTITTEWHPDFRLPTKITEPSRITEYAYDANGNRLSETVTDTATGRSRTTTWTYNQYGQVLTEDGPRSAVSDITTYRYDASGNLTATENALGQITRVTAHDAHGNPLRIVDPNGVVTELEYDLRQRLIRRSVAVGLPEEATTRFDYDAVGQLTRVTLPNGAFIRYEYDAAHRLTAIEDALGNRIDYTLDAMGNRVKEEVFGPAGTLIREQARDYNTLNRLVGEINGVGERTDYAYDAVGNRTAVTDPAGNTTAYTYDALNRLTKVTDALGGQTTYAYDPLDQLTRVTDPRGVTTTYDYNAFGDVRAVHSPDAGTTTYTYDAAGNRITQTDARGITATYTYDAANRLTGIDYPGTEEDIAFTYDQGSHGIGRLTAITDPSGTIAYTYGPRGNIKEETRTLGGTALTTSYGYDKADNLIQMTYPSGMTVALTRDAMGRITDITATIGGTAQVLAASIGYQPFGPVDSFTYGNGIELTRSFDLAGRLTTQTAGAIQNLAWRYSPTGNITAISDNVNVNRSQSFGYDELYRLTSASGAYGTKTYAYDPVGNRTRLTDNGATTTYRYAADSNRLTTAGGDSYQYAANGNTVDDGSIRYSYNNRNRLATAEQNSQLIGQYEYNALGQRVKKIANGQTTSFVYSQAGQLIGEYDTNGSAIREYVYLDGVPLALVPGQNPSQHPQLPSEGVIVDDPQALLSGNWLSSSLFSGYYGSGYRVLDARTGDQLYACENPLGGGGLGLKSDGVRQQAPTGPSGGQTGSATWTFSVPSSEDYTVYARWAAASNRTTVPYTIYHDGGQTVVDANQQFGPVDVTGWHTLGSYPFTTGQTYRIRMDSQPGCVVADAVSLAKTTPTAPELAVYYYHADHLGTPQQLTDASGVVMWDAVYVPFGEADLQVNQIEQPLRFPGQYRDQETGLNYNYFRTYNPATGRYTQSDPIGLAGGVNIYDYSFLNPLNYIDEYGLKPDFLPVPIPGMGPQDVDSLPPSPYANSEAQKREFFSQAVGIYNRCRTRCIVSLLNPYPTGAGMLLIDFKFGPLLKKAGKQMLLVVEGAYFIDCMKQCEIHDPYCDS